MTEETQGASPVEDAPVLPSESEAADSSPAPQAQPEAEPNDAQTPPRDEEGKFLSPKAQQRIDHLTWEKNQREREAEYWRQLALQAQQPRQPAPEAPAQPVKLPTLEEHGYDEAKYQAALLDYAARQAESVVEKRLKEADAQRSEQARAESFATRQREFAKSAPDFEDKVLRDPTLPITEAMRDVILDSDAGPELAYYLANNRGLAEQIARLPAHLAALEMGRIDGRIAAEKEAKKAAATKPKPVVTQAPPPPPTVETNDAEVSKDPYSDEMSLAEWNKWREKQLRKAANKR